MNQAHDPDWVVYYGDGSTYSSEDGSSPPARDVQVIVQRHPEVGVELVTASDYYVWRNGRWWGVDLFGLFDYLTRPGPKKVLFGRTIETEVYKRIIKRACEDTDLMRGPRGR